MLAIAPLTLKKSLLFTYDFRYIIIPCSFSKKGFFMDFSFSTYANLVEQLRLHQYTITNYKDYAKYTKAAILRHDIDFSIEDNYNFSLFEDKLGIKSTYFVLLSTGFYNPMLKYNRELLKSILKRGHSIGLHFDTTAYDNWQSKIQAEKSILENIIDAPVDLISFHRPAPEILDNNLQFSGLINVYSQEFFGKFKYCSDSRFHWRDNPFELINSGKYPYLHILTHPFAWHKTDIPPRATYINLISKASLERYKYYTQNIRHPEEFITSSEANNLWNKIKEY